MGFWPSSFMFSEGLANDVALWFSLGTSPSITITSITSSSTVSGFIYQESWLLVAKGVGICFVRLMSEKVSICGLSPL